MVGLIRGRLGGFMSQHNLTEYMASIGMPEVEKVKQREEIISRQMQQLTQNGDETAEKKDIKAPDFQARYKIKNLFAQFADEFTGKARGNGVELHWIGVGTWESPVNIVPEKHLEAWLLTQENLKNDSQEEMNKIEQKESVEKMKELIQKVPLDVFENIITMAKQTRRSGRPQPQKKKETRKPETRGDDFIVPEDEMSQVAEQMFRIWQTMNVEKPEDYHPSDIEHAHDIQELLLEYRKQFQETADFIKHKNETVPQNISDAIRYIDNQIAHWAGLF
jgi:Txe/YoeB family toxin of Txe-Axe toxin-antitoxin module